ncbi:MAG: BadF/BadG/BcrA/BcrD ATPase family protein [Actinomycetaceae bacterium]|nr:BadF/BadG/BcrA/BcrD ATPase family protein [Actinomycetaceae bacterium]MDY6082545.1 BadF/BadG/BcrA/BcrD ATPase family protein [Actinomycetaceae bacterium]
MKGETGSVTPRGRELSDPVVCIDAGQTGMRAELRANGTAAPQGSQTRQNQQNLQTRQSQLTRVTVARAELPGIVAGAPVLPQLTPLVNDLLDRYAALGAPAGSVRIVCAGVSGLDRSESAEEWLGELAGVGIRSVHAAHDSISSYLGALGQAPGAVVASGTGAVTVALGERNVVRVDGWGSLLGDFGSAYWMGREGLSLVLRSYDGRAEQTALTPIVTADFPDLSTMYTELQKDPRHVARIASYSKVVADLADSHADEACARIASQAGELLAESVNAGLARTGQQAERAPHIGMVGKVFDSITVRRAFTDAVMQQHPEAQFVRADGRGLDGAERLATLPASSPLAQDVLVASVARGAA